MNRPREDVVSPLLHPIHVLTSIRTSFPRCVPTDDDEFEVAEIKKDEPKQASTFDDEEEEEEPVKKAPSKPKPAKKEVEAYVDETLADPVAEKLRRQKLVEEADLIAAKELFGTDGEAIDLTTYAPKSEKEFAKYGNLVATKYMTVVKDSAFYKETVKAFIKNAVRNSSAAEIKEIEASIVAIRNDKVKKEKADAALNMKAEQAEKAKAGKGKKKFLNMKGVKGANSGLDDYKYDSYTPDDDYDFM